MGGLFTALTNSAGALQVYGRVFSVIQNNVANASTPGYARQEQTLVAEPFNPAEGLSGGVLAGPMVSTRSQYLERAVRYQQEQLGSAQQKATDLSQIEPLFDVSGQSGVPGALSQFFNSFSQLSVNPNDLASRQNVIDAASQVAEAFHQNALGIARVAGDIDTQTRASVTAINQAAAEIADINQHYRSSSQVTQDAGLDARLHAALESLSQVADYTLLKASDGSYSIYLGGQTPLVIGDHAYDITADFSGPQTVIRDAQGNDVTGQLTNAGGSLGAMLQEKNATLPAYMTSLDNVAKVLADTVNTALGQGLDRGGNAPLINLFTYSLVAGAASSLGVTGITPDQIAAASAGAPGGNGNALALAQLAGQPTVNGFTFIEAYGNLGSQVGRDVSNAKQDRVAQQDLVTQTQQQRALVSGVSLDAEAAKLLQFQQSYQAMGKLVTVLDGLTQTVIDLIR
jgi:flagellar hook-associated protein 1 FlgK